MVDRVEVVREMAATPEVVWQLIWDLPRMGEWSPENTGGEWTKGATGPEVGAKFKGRNQAGSTTWSTMSTVTDAARGERFSFSVVAGPFKIADWAFAIEPHEGGCRVTQSWTDRRGWLMKTIGTRASGVDDRAEFSRQSMEQTLAGVASAAESTSA